MDKCDFVARVFVVVASNLKLIKQQGQRHTHYAGPIGYAGTNFSFNYNDKRIKLIESYDDNTNTLVPNTYGYFRTQFETLSLVELRDVLYLLMPFSTNFKNSNKLNFRCLRSKVL